MSRARLSRVQLALNVADVEEAVVFYTKLLGTPPAKVRAGYANFAVDDPPLKLVLIEDGAREPGSVNHLGVEVPTRDAVAAATDRLRAEGLATAVEDEVTCCYALQDKVWVRGPGGEPWEIYTVLEDSDEPVGEPCCGASGVRGEPACCGPRSGASAAIQ